MQFRVTSKTEDQRLPDIIRLVHMTDWARDRPDDVIRRAVEHSINFGVIAEIDGAEALQVAYCRVITDQSTFAYLADVIVDEKYRGRGLSRLMMESVMSHPVLQNLHCFCLLTSTAHGLYRKFGFENLVEPERYMARFDD